MRENLGEARHMKLSLLNNAEGRRTTIQNPSVKNENKKAKGLTVVGDEIWTCICVLFIKFLYK